MLGSTEVKEFQSSGKLLIPELFTSSETLAMQLEVDRWIEEGLFRDVSTNPSVQNLQCIPLHPKSPLFRALGNSSKVVGAVEALIGAPVVKILDQSFYKPAKSGMATNWHTDNAYFQVSDPLVGLAMWIAIHDATQKNGCLRVVPNAYDTSFPHQRDPASDHHIRTEIDESSALHCELDAGGVVFFCFGTPHATGDNQSESGRAGVGIHYVNTAKIDGPNADRWRDLELKSQLSRNSADDQFDSLVKRATSKHKV